VDWIQLAQDRVQWVDGNEPSGFDQLNEYQLLKKGHELLVELVSLVS
jgi:hypothetical protein